MSRAKLTPEERSAKRAKWWSETKMDLKWVTALLFVLILTGPLLFVYTGLDRGLANLYGREPTGLSGPYADWEVETAGEENLTAVTDEIFSQDALVVPFEILSVLLLAALIAGVVIALRDVETRGR